MSGTCSTHGIDACIQDKKPKRNDRLET